LHLKLDLGQEISVIDIGTSENGGSPDPTRSQPSPDLASVT